MIIIFQHIIKKITTALADLEGGVLQSPLSNFKNKREQ